MEEKVTINVTANLAPIFDNLIIKNKADDFSLQKKRYLKDGFKR